MNVTTTEILVAWKKENKLICARHRHGGKFIKLKMGHSSMGIFVLRVLYLFRYRQWSEIWYGLNVFFKVNLVDMKLAYDICLMFCFHALLDCVGLLQSIVCICCSQKDSLVCWSVMSPFLPLFCLLVPPSASLKAANILPNWQGRVTDRIDQILVDIFFFPVPGG